MPRVGLDVADEGLVNLELVKAQGHQIGERGPAGAEIIQRDAHVDVFELREDALAEWQIVECDGFGQLQNELFGAQRALLQHLVDLVEQGWGEHGVGEVDGQLQLVHEAGRQLRHVVVDPAEDPFAEQLAEAVLLRHGDDVQRVDEAVFGVMPADQHLGPHVVGIARFYHRLIVQIEGAVGDDIQMFTQLGGQFPVAAVVLEHPVVEYLQVVLLELFGIGEGNVGEQDQLLDLVGRDGVLAYSHADAHPVRRIGLKDGGP